MKKFRLLSSIFITLLLASCETKNVDSFSHEQMNNEIANNENNNANENEENNDNPPLIEKNIDDCQTTEQIKTFAGNNYQKIIDDNNFKYGFRLTKVVNNGDPYYQNKINFYDKFIDDDPVWTMAQWNSKYDLGSDQFKYQINEEKLKHTVYGYKQNGVPCKSATFNSETGAIDMELNASIEYEHARQNNEPWPAFLLSQSKTNKTAIKLDQLSSLIVDVNYKVNKCENKMNDEDYISSSHSAQLVLFLTVQNRTVGHPDYGKYIWFGFNLFDYRYSGKVFPKGTQLDKGTNRMIYKTSSEDTMLDTNGKQPLIGEQGHCNYDMLNDAKASLEEATRQGYFTSTKWEDMYIGGFNFGFEVPGTFDISASIQSINFFYK